MRILGCSRGGGGGGLMMLMLLGMGLLGLDDGEMRMLVKIVNC